MKIYILDGNQEQGPYSRAEVFSLLKEGTLEPATSARWENQDEWQPLKEVLEKGTSAFFSLEQIKKQQEETPPAPIIIPDFLPRPRDESDCEPETKGKGKALVLAACAIAFGAYGIFFLLNNLTQSKEGSPPEVLAKKAVLVTPTISPASLASADSSTPAAKQVEPTPKITPPPIQDETNANEGPIENLSKEQNALEEKPPEIAESTPSPPSPIQTLPVVAESEVAKEKTQMAFEKSTASMDASKNAEINPFETREVSESELVQILQDRFSYDGFAKRISIQNHRLNVFEGSFTLETNLKTNPKVEIIYAIPLNPNRSAGPKADNIVMEGQWPGAMEPTNGVTVVKGKTIPRKRGLPGDLRSYCDSLGCTVFMPLIHSPREIWNDPKESYFQGGKEWVDLVFRAQQEIIKRHHLRPHKLILCGFSLGATFVERVAAARPEAVAAVAVQDAPEISVPNPDAKSDAVWFLEINRGDSMRSEYARLCKALVQQKRSMIFTIFPPNYDSRRGDGELNYHIESWLTETARFLFIKGILEKQTPDGANDLRKWIYVRDRTNPVGIFAATSDRAKNIPEEKREYLPSKDFVDLLQSLPAPMQILTLSDPQHRKDIKSFVGLPPLGKPTGVAIYLHKPELMDIPRLIDNIYFLTGKGFLVIAPKLRDFDDAALQGISQFVKKAQPLQALPLVYVGWGDANNFMWRSIADLKVAPPNALAAIGFRVTDDFDPVKLPVGGGIKCPMLFVYDERPLMAVNTEEEAQKSLKTVSSVKQYVEACRVKGQFARVAVIAAPAEGPIRGPISDQQAINYASDFVQKIAAKRMGDITLP